MAKSTKKKKLRYASIGAGGIAGRHLMDMAKFEDVEIVGLADINEKGMHALADKYEIDHANCYTDYREMLDKLKPDAVSVCTPNGLHAQNSIDALEAGAHVIVEKPMAMTAKEAQKMIDVAKKKKRKLVIGFQWRYGANSQFLRKQVEEGRFGDIMYARSQAIRRRGIPNWGVFGRKELQGGGPLIDIGVHILEVTHYVMGSPKPIAATGKTFTYMGDKKSNTVSQWPNWDHKTYTVEDLAVGQIRFDNGAVLTVESSFIAHTKNVFTFELMGTKAGATWDPPEIFHDHGGYMMNSKPDFLPTNVDNFTEKMRNFVDHVLYNKPSMAPAEHGLMVQKMLDALYESAEKGKEVLIK